MARSKRRKHVISETTQKYRPKFSAQKSHEDYFSKFSEEGLDSQKLMSQVELLEKRIKETKKNILHERQMNAMLKEENENLRHTNKLLTKDDRHKATKSLPVNSRVTENIYENFMMSDLKSEFERTQGQITQLMGKQKFTQYDIEAIKTNNKQIVATIERYKKILKDHSGTKPKEKEVKIDDVKFRRYFVLRF